MHDDIRPNMPEPPKESNENTPFLTPDEAATKDSNPEISESNPNRENTVPVNSSNPMLGKGILDNSPPKSKKHKLWPPTKKQLIIGGSILAVILIVGGGLTYMALRHKPITANIPVAKAPAKPKPKPASNTVASTLTGLQVPPADNNRPITAVMIENTTYARPQAGLSQAGVVFEALTEGGITRFMALFQDQLPTFVGPVRSARPYFIDWSMGFDAPYAHAGGSPQALSYIQSQKVKNLDYMYYPNYYTRISSRPAPHNLYTNIVNLVSLEAKLGWTSSTFTGWPRKADSPSKSPNATNINFNPSYSTYNVSYSYNAQTDSYERDEAGAAQTDANTGQQLNPKVVIGLIVPWSQGSLDSSGAYYSTYQDIGSGKAYVFQDGTLTVGQWSKSSPTAALTFTNSAGQPLKLNAGQTWITALADTSEISYN